MRRLRPLAIAAVLALVLAPSVWAAEMSRTDYKAAVEPICKRDTRANERILAGVKTEVRRGRLKPAAAKFARASAELKRALREIEAVDRPAADEARLERWFSLVASEAKLFATAGRKLKAGNKARAQRLVVKLSRTANKANLQVLPFSFQYCRLNPARFT